MDVLSRFAKVKVFVFDIDGVLTNGQLLVQEDGTLLRSMNIKDGYALQLAVKKGYPVIIISGGKSIGTKLRLERLGIQKVFIGVENKVGLLKELVVSNKWNFDEILYMGDDMPDLSVMQICGLRACPKDAIMEIQEISDYISSRNGGEGCAREVLEKVMKIQGKWA